jgi:8-amino-7-oxononanoate synthase
MRADSPLVRRLVSRLDAWEREGLRRTLRPPSGIDLSSNDYLQLARHPEVCRAFASAVAREGSVGSTGSRLLRGERERFADLETRFATFKGAERALYFSSGYLANLAVLTALTEPEDVVFSDALNHASLIDGVRLSRADRVVFPHRDLDRLDDLLAHTPCRGVRFVVTESVFSMDGDVSPLHRFVSICQRYEAVPIVDEAHGVGIFGRRGTGVLEETAVDPTACVSINTAGKALGVAGAFVAGPSAVIDTLVQRARPFVFSTAPPPAVVDAIEASLTLVEREPERRIRVRALADRLRSRLSDRGVAVPDGDSQIVPIPVGDNARAVSVAARLADDGFDVRAIRPPSVPVGTARLRVSVNAGLDEPTVDRFASAVATAMQEVGLCSAASS